MTEPLGPLHARVAFGSAIGPDAQAKALFELEKLLRAITGQDCRAYKDLMGDDSKLRVMMTPKQREKL